jgi:hypothetical protein
VKLRFCSEQLIFGFIRLPQHGGYKPKRGESSMTAVRKHKPGAFCWADLGTTDVAGAKKFYGCVSGWKTKFLNFSGNAYTLFNLAEKQVGGMWPAPMKELPPCWLTYWQASNCAKTVARVRRLGGRVRMGTTTVPKTCRFAVLTDPQGAAFGVLEPL